MESPSLDYQERITRRDALVQTGIVIWLQKVTCHVKSKRVRDFRALARSNRELGTQHQREFGDPSVLRGVSAMGRCQ